MSTPKRHHFVPEFYLRRFANPRGQVVAFDRAKQRSFKTSVSNVAVEAGFYTVVDQGGQEVQVVEETLGEIETKASEVIKGIDRHGTPPTGEDRAVLALFLALQMTRTRDFRDRAEAHGDLMAKVMMDMNLQAMTPDQKRHMLRDQLGREPTDEDIRSLERTPEHFDSVRIEISNNEFALLMLQLAQHLEMELQALSWHLLVYRKPGFLTCDQPITLWREPRPGDMGGIGVRTADVIYFTLDPEKALVLSPDGTGVPLVIEATPRWVKDVNQLIARNSYDRVFHHPKHDPLSGIMIPQDRPMFIVNGWPVHRGENPWKTISNSLVVDAKEHGETFIVSTSHDTASHVSSRGRRSDPSQ